MATYDVNGTTKNETGKIYDVNSTTKSQIGKVYDVNGTTKSLIYSYEQTITAPSGVSIYSGDPYERRTSSTNYTEYFDVSGYDNISGSITCKQTADLGARPYGVHGYIDVGLYNSSGTKIASQTLGASAWSTTVTNTGTFSFSLTGKTGNHRIGIFVSTQRENSDEAQAGTMSGSISGILMKGD